MIETSFFVEGYFKHSTPPASPALTNPLTAPF
jgi:hypothetical protein